MKKLSNKQLNFVVALRVVVGWHFLYEGLSKLFTPGWSSAEFLYLSNWWFAPFYHWIAETPTVLAIADFFNVWGLILIGLALFIGLFERIAVVSGVVLLTMYYFANPPFVGNDFGVITEGNYLIVNKNMIEVFALLIFWVLPTSKYIGIDKFIFRKKEPKVMPLVNKTERKDTEPVADENEHLKRRELLKGLATIPVLGVFGAAFYQQKKWDSWEDKNLVDANTSASTKSFNSVALKELKQKIPKATVAGNEYSRLILGGNLLSGWAHSRDLLYVSQLVKAYHNKDRIFSTLLLAEKCGINTLLTNPILCSLITEYWKRGIGDIQFISDCAGLDYDDKGAHASSFDVFLDRIKLAIDSGATACYIQGETADYYLQNGKATDLEKAMQYVTDRNISLGIGAHRIETIQTCVENGYNPDFWMKTLHDHNYWSARHPEWHDNMYCFNPSKTIEYMESLPQPWVAFKVMAAGAIQPKEAFNYAFQNGADFICAGMYDFQMVEDVNITNDILMAGVKRKRHWLV